ncbi:MAG: WecB/TagA/CpsF family glycosyltransferase [Acidobacteria bacterium]|nr:WecB/TagA/CpsF family glycosyltransferase [Acidobacteriota bacterium]
MKNLYQSRVINGFRILAFQKRDDFLDYISGCQKILIAMNAEKIMNTVSGLKEIVNRNVAYPDGIGAVLALRQKGIHALKMPGVELWLDIVRRYRHDKSFYLIGSTREVVERTVSGLRAEFQGIRITGYRDGFLGAGEEEELKNELLEKAPDVVFVAMGSPGQELLMDELIRVYPALYMGLGGSFDVYCGLKKRAPKIFIRLGMEWLYRLFREPARIKRQPVRAKFLFMLLTGRL